MRKYTFRCGLALVLATASLFAQKPGTALQFEVATIKPAAPLDQARMMAGKMHIGMSVEAGRVNIGFMSLSDLVMMAYKVKPHQITGPDWMKTERFDILAKLPEGATKEQVPEMMQALLADRFKMTIHRDSKEHSVYELVVGKNGSKLKEALPDEPAPAAADGAPPAPAGRGGMVIGTGENQMRVNPSSDGRGSTITGGPMGRMKMSMGEGGVMRMEFGKMSMAALAETLTRFTDRPVVDKTGLTENYQVALDLSMDDMRNVARASGMAGMMGPGGGEPARAPADAASTPGGASIFSTVQQMGLKLEPRKAAMEMIVVDRLEKMPTEN